ncbi:hypothetical protein BCR39DRAFT_592170 [Naematelia encephala]|uniref:Cation efflux family-domain-containing protein n=1 Tax=Naematelia encephala TaxID=71784 RepID=A0A1Y2BMA8_9TREE|nr:hypothetical protein BCR39DRAFT_592170 [Naematelia encephala]
MTSPSLSPSPDQPSSRRSSLASPQIDTPNPALPTVFPPSPSPSPTQSHKEPLDVFSPTASNALLAPFDATDSTPVLTPLTPTLTRVLNNPPSRRTTVASTRAPPPPPILVRRPTELGNRVEDIAIPSSAGASPRGSAKGLNISGLPDTPGTIERESFDFLPELVPTPSPRRASFRPRTPNSPAWASFDAGPMSPPRFGASTLDVPSARGSPSTRDINHFDPTPQHGLHARNLSLYFPQPGQAPVRSAPGTPMVQSPEQIQDVLVPSAERGVFGGGENWSFGTSRAESLEPARSPDGVKRSKRRGHHHKHSLSHNFFSFLDPTETNPQLSTPIRPPPSPSPVSDVPLSVPMPNSTTTANALSPLPRSKSDPQGQFLSSFALLEFLIGAGLWVEGQMSGWRCLAGVGYLVVFDALGVGIEVIAQRGDTPGSLRRAYGTPRLLALLYFAQCLFLTFSAVYIAKESIEQVVLGAHAHSEAGAGAHSHGGAELDGDERPFPVLLLFLAGLASVFSGAFMRNHAKLVDAVGPLFLPSRWIALPMIAALPLLSNPFTIGVAGSSFGVMLGSILVPPDSLHGLDSTLSLVLTLLTISLSYPPARAFGLVLLQTAPPASQSQMASLQRVLKEIREDRRVLGIGRTRCWAITNGHRELEHISNAPTPSSLPASPASPTIRPRTFSAPSSAALHDAFRRASYSYTSGDERQGDVPLVVTLEVHVSEDLSDREVMEVTRYVWSKVSGAVRVKSGSTGGNSQTGISEGEVSVAAKRGWAGMEVD